MPEYQDIYDIHRKLTGKKVLRGTPRSEDEYILVIHMLLFDENGRFLCVDVYVNCRLQIIQSSRKLK